MEIVNNTPVEFVFKDNTVRVIVCDSEPWFVAKDVCEFLLVKNCSQACNRLDEEECKTTHIADQQLPMLVISESGLYSLVLSSKKPEAREFKRWITKEVIPSIRKHGAYATDDVMEKVIADPDFGMKLLSSLKESRRKQQELRIKAAEEQQRRICAESNLRAVNSELSDLSAQLGLSTNYATVKMVQAKTGKEYHWKALKEYSTAHHYPIDKVADNNYVRVNAYSKDAWSGCYGVDLEDIVQM